MRAGLLFTARFIRERSDKFRESFAARRYNANLTKKYSAKCVEEKFSEVRLYEGLARWHLTIII
jgi:hypothetical protein